MKIAFSFFLLIYSRCGAPTSWAARHTAVCLDIVGTETGNYGKTSRKVSKLPSSVLHSVDDFDKFLMVGVQ